MLEEIEQRQKKSAVMKNNQRWEMNERMKIWNLNSLPCELSLCAHVWYSGALPMSDSAISQNSWTLLAVKCLYPRWVSDIEHDCLKGRTKETPNQTIDKKRKNRKKQSQIVVHSFKQEYWIGSRFHVLVIDEDRCYQHHLMIRSCCLTFPAFCCLSRFLEMTGRGCCYRCKL